MTATFNDVEEWKKQGKEMKATHIISVCDTFDYDDYPVFVMPEQSLKEMREKYDGVNMQRINEIIPL